MLKVLSKKLVSTKKQVSKEWLRYRKTKEKIFKNKRLSLTEKKALRDEFLYDTRKNISEKYLLYRERKAAIINKSPYENFAFIKSSTLKTKYGKQKIYKANSKFSVKDLDKTVEQVLYESGVTGLLVIFSVESQETGQKQYVSNYITKDLYELSIKGKQTVFEYVSERLRAGNTKDYHLKFIYLRIIYANPKNSNPKNTNGKNKK